MKNTTSLKALCAAAGIAAAAAAVPANAQRVVEEITVEGYQGKLPDHVKRAATVVSYSDLDLSTDWGRDELRKRVRLTARYLCEKLGETNHSSGVVPSCRDQAVRDTMKRVGTIEANAVPRGSAWVQPPPWAAPYPTAWVEETTYSQPYPAPPPPAQTYRTYETQPYPAQPAPTRYYTPASEPYYEY
ncbi:MAG: UrcA family protein [Sphingomonadales bacterium]